MLGNNAYGKEAERERRRFIERWYRRNITLVHSNFDEAKHACFREAVTVGLYSHKTYWADARLIGRVFEEQRGF